MALNDALCNRKTNARAFEFLGAVQPLKNAEQLAGVFHVKAGAVVVNEVNALAVFRATANSNHRGVAATSVLERVGKKVGEHLSQQHRIRFATGKVFNFNVHAPAIDIGTEFVKN